ncbi:hypothetical protein WN51_10154 [Melipona quadrifasciata]|uniref:Uncharacterized protein n=1 Tax=Melipona quadrifasciata TaxID=166423 RepID=A0A0N0BJC7_9HYME|nr:hypothetical protein WN51_10154 [Melipona quadrifasciata]
MQSRGNRTERQVNVPGLASPEKSPSIVSFLRVTSHRGGLTTESIKSNNARETEKKERTLRFGENPNTIPETHGSQPLNPTPYQHTSRQSSSWTRRPGQMPGYQQWKQCVLTTRRDATLRGVTAAPRSLRAVPVPGHFTPSARTSQDHASCRYRGKQGYRSNIPTIDHPTE